MRRLFKRIFLHLSPLFYVFFWIFYDRKYLQGRHFDPGPAGYIWCFKSIWQRSLLRLALPMPFPAGLGCYVSNWRNIHFHCDDLNNFQSSGTYFQNFAGNIYIGKGCYIAPNVGIITANHDPLDLDKHSLAQDVVLGTDCWVGMNSVILPGVVLGPSTVVGAGSVVTKSFRDGYCVIAGNPAKLIRSLNLP